MRRNFVMYVALVVAFCVGAIILSRAFARTGHQEGADQVINTSDRSCLAVIRSLELGHFLEESDLSWRRCPATQTLTGGYYINDSEKMVALAGALLRSPMAEGEFLTISGIVRPGDSQFLAAVLKPGTRAMAIRVDDVTGGAGLIRPGNRVDVIMSGTFSEGDGTVESATAKTLLSAVRVIAVNRDIGLPKPNNDTSLRASAQREATKGTVTLEVSPKEVELLTVAKTLGVLSLSLCSLATDQERQESDVAETSSETRAREIVRQGSSQAQEKSMVVTMFGTEQSQMIRR
ncbi:MAG: Flp pilus assembly protein CpaB [Deltaproteobacteria bacterium]|jgi:pilus assembly protein CpaB|nr:Flp pilus assembly protein CpaB [Deltaproteobacteria bacterium]